MVNEEAIKILANFKRYISGGGVVDREANAAIDMAISALKLSDSIIKQLDCKMFHSGVNVEDTISDETTDIIYRQAAIDAIRNNVFAVTPTQIDTKIDCIESVEAVPSAQPEPCEDVVSREYLTEHIEACWMNGRMMKPDLNEVLSWIDDIPSAQSEVAKDTNVPINDCINRQAAISAITSHSGVVDKSAAKRILAQLPPVQPETIRCKDCKHRLSSLYCEAWNNSPGFPCIGDEMFCSMAERRTDDDRNG